MEEEQPQEQTTENGQGQENYTDANVEMESQDNANAEQGGGDGDGNEDDDDRKLFVGGLSWETTQKDLKEYFQKFGEVSNCTLKTDLETRRSRGFGFVVFADAASIDKVLEEGKVHKLHGRTIDPKRANPRGKEPQKKVYVGKVNPTTTEETLREYFEKFGKITKVELPYNRNEEKRRDFVFIEFEKEDTVQQVLGSHKVEETDVEVKIATPNSNQRGRGRGMGFFRGGERGGARGGGRGGRGGYGGGWNDYGGDYYGYGQGYGAGYGYGYGQNYDQNYYQGGYGGQGWGGYDNYYNYNNYGAEVGTGQEGWDNTWTAPSQTCYDSYWNPQGQQNASYGKTQKRGGHTGNYRPY